VISGTPTASGTSNFTVRVTDSASATDNRALTLTINALVVTNAVYEGFNYTVGAKPSTQTQPVQFGGYRDAGAEVIVSAGSLSYTNGGTLATSGNKLSGGNWQSTGMRMNFSNSVWTPYKVTANNQYGNAVNFVGQGTMYVSFLMQATQAADFGLYTGDTNADAFGQLAVGATVNVASNGAVTLRTASYNPSSLSYDKVASDGTTGSTHTVQNASLSVTGGSVNLYVLKIEFGATTKVSLYLNPTVGGTEPGTASASLTTPAGEKLIFNAFATFLGYNANSNFLDELRFGGTWADVVPSNAPPLTGIAAWANSYGLPTDGTGNGSPTAILAGDGITNLMKYALGISPNIPGYQGRLTTGTVNVGGSDYLSLTYTRPEPAPTGVAYIPQACSDLSTWSGNGLRKFPPRSPTACAPSPCATALPLAHRLGGSCS
jgi:hypothetical protein